jgi:ADP-ribose pyrophosphatase YjhB (NUDIX family)
MLWRQTIEPLIRPFFHAYARATRGLTLGVRGLVLDEDGRVLLVHHTYVRGWHLPGGGIERGESAEQALARELVEEAGVEVVGRPELVSVHANHKTFKGDHVLLYRIGRWRPCPATARGEIHEVGWFAPDALPDGTTRSTRRRIAEALSGAARDAHW